jgi:hypothetical protein
MACQIGGAGDEVMIDPHLHLAANPQRRLQKHIQGVIDHALGGIFYRHHPVIGGTGLDFAEHFINGPQRNAVDRFAEMLERGRLGKGAFRAQKRDSQRFLQRQAGRHDLAEQPGHFLVAERPLIGFDHPPQHLRLALRAVKIAAGAGRLFERADLLRATRPFGDQRLNLPIQRVDLSRNASRLSASLIQPPRRRRYHPAPSRSSSARIAVAFHLADAFDLSTPTSFSIPCRLISFTPCVLRPPAKCPRPACAPGCRRR